MAGNGLVVQATSYLASESNIDIELGFQGFKSLFSGESIFWLDISTVLVESGGMAALDSGIKMKSKMQGGKVD